MNKERKELSIIIPNYNDPKGLRDTVSTLFKENPDIKNYELIIINDGGLEVDVQSGLELQKKYEYIIVLEVKPNKGSYNARNEGLKIARGKYIAFLDSGIFVQKGWYKNALKWVKKYDYVGGAVEVPFEWAKTLGEKYDSLTAFPMGTYFKELHFCGIGNLIVKREVIDKVGLLNNNLRSGGDGEFGRRVYRAGLKQYYCGVDMLIYHEPRNFRQLFKKILRVNKGIYDLRRKDPDRFGGNNIFREILYYIKIILLSFFRKDKRLTELNYFQALYCSIVINIFGLIALKNSRTNR